MIIRTTLFLIFLVHSVATAQVLDTYVKEALEQNELLKQKSFQLEKSLAALAEAKGLFWPALEFSTTYTRADGGRTIDLPLGDLLNPVYSTLNQLTQSGAFPQLQNQSVLLNPDDFYDAKIKATWPVLNAEIKYNRTIKRDLAEIQRFELETYRRELTKEVKTAWYQYKQASEAVTIYENALELVKESERVNQRLVSNGKALPTAVRRAKNEVVKMESQIASAKESRDRAGYYFNFLLNRDLKEGIVTEDISVVEPAPATLTAKVEKREELLQLDKALDAASGAVALERAFHVPKLNVFVDAGSQGFDFEVNRSSWYYLGGVQVSVPLFTGGRHRERLKQAEAEKKSLQSQRASVKQQLTMQLNAASDAYFTAKVLLESARTQREFAENYYADMARLYKEGALLYIELLDAQNQLTSAQLQESIAASKLGIRLAELDRAAGPQINP